MAEQQEQAKSGDSLATPIGGIVGSVALCVLIAWVAGAGASIGGLPVLVWCAILAMGVQWVVFIHAWSQNTEHFFDLTGSLTFLTVTWFAIFASDAFDVRSLVLAAAISIWAVRLGTFLFSRVRAAGEDRRFRALKASFPMFLMTWTLQGSWVFVTACCALAAISVSSQASAPLGVLFYLGALMWIVGFVVEVIADTQKSRFKADPANENRFIRDGLWAWSRHPNYFGEILLWAGIAVMAAPVLSGWQLITLISPLFVIVQLTVISGVPLLERRAHKQWGEDPEYQAYRKRTPTLVPFPPRAA